MCCQIIRDHEGCLVVVMTGTQQPALSQPNVHPHASTRYVSASGIHHVSHADRHVHQFIRTSCSSHMLQADRVCYIWPCRLGMVPGGGGGLQPILEDLAPGCSGLEIRYDCKQRTCCVSVRRAWGYLRIVADCGLLYIVVPANTTACDNKRPEGWCYFGKCRSTARGI
jgi:hypothetical protein